MACLFNELEEFQEYMKEKWVENSLPFDWHDLNETDPVVPKRTKVTLRLDSDLLAWFRKLGPGYQARINQVLRIYWLALRAGKIYLHYEEPEAGPLLPEVLSGIIKQGRRPVEG
ncbi:MAG: BrnA antitoxin family protein [Rhodobacteraceae bacterium]|nr:BrnA antitoxin family protein [Paracoccaceae bacterium]